MIHTNREDLERTPVQSADQTEQSRVLSDRTVARHGAMVPGFQLLEPLGEGAYGEVWLAREDKTGRQVAVKFYTHRRGLDWSLLSREVEKLAMLYTSRNIVRLIDVGWHADPPYYVMEYLERGSLEARLKDGPLEADEAVRIIQSICQALVHAHGRGVLHCDLKPANVLLDASFEPRLCDFGQSRLSNEQDPALGTLFYMAPEQADLAAVPDACWDVYALGALFYHLLVGRPPYRNAANEEKLQSADRLDVRLAAYRQLVAAGPRPSEHWHAYGVYRQLAEIIDRCLRVDPSRRYANAQQVLDHMLLRERQRRLRPLVALGGIGPGLILLAMFFFASNAMDSAVETAEHNLTSRALESDVMSAGILAQSIEREIQDRLDELTTVASDPLLRQAIEESSSSNWSHRLTFDELLDSTRNRIDERRSERERELDTSWFLTDRHGFQRWRSPLDEDIYDENYAYRDYFHGHDRQYPIDAVPAGLEPITRPHVSLPLESTATKRNMIALSVPVWSLDGTTVIGVLARTTHLDQLLSQYKGSLSGQDGVARTFALADTRSRQLLDHSRFNDEANGKTSANAESLVAKMQQFKSEMLLDDAMVKQLLKSRSGLIRESSYSDPLRRIDPDESSGEWLAALARVEETQWAAIVQERKADVLQPVYEMRSRLVRYAWLAFGVSGLVVATLWYFALKSVISVGLRRRAKTGRISSIVGQGTGVYGDSGASSTRSS